jgi:hypothetical protein
MGLDTKGIGGMICKMDKEWRAGQMEADMKVVIGKE